MNGTEFESNWFSHNFQRHITNNDLRRELALTRMAEKQQQQTQTMQAVNSMQSMQGVATQQPATALDDDLPF